MEKRALLVEDNLGDVELFKTVFEELNTGMRLDVAFHNGSIPNVIESSGAYGSTGIPKIIFLDINLPGVSGLDILKAIRASEQLKFIPVVILTSSANETDIIRAYKLGASGYIIKPMDYDSLVDKIRSTLNFWLQICTVPEYDS